MSKEKERAHFSRNAGSRTVGANKKDSINTEHRRMHGIGSGGGRVNGLAAGGKGGGGQRRAPNAPAFVRGTIFGAARKAERVFTLSAAEKGIAMLGAFVLGVLFARADALFSVYPLGIALLCASAKHMPWILAGSFAGSMSLGPVGYVYAAVEMMVGAVRLLISVYGKDEMGRGRFAHSTGTRVYLSAMAAFICGIYNMVRYGYRYYDLFGSFLLIAMCPFVTWMLSVGEKERDGRSKTVNTAVNAVFFSCLVYSVSDFKPFGISVAAIGVYLLTSLVGKKLGALYGMGTGAVLGLAGAPDFMHVFSIAGLCMGIARHLPHYVSSALSFAAACVTAYAAGGGAGLLAVLPALSVGVSLWVVGERLGLTDMTNCFLGQDSFANDETDEGLPTCEERFEALSESFRSLSEVCYALSDRYRRPDTAELRGLCNDVCDKYCKRCRTSPLCWNREYSSTADVMGKVVSSLSEGKRVTRGNLPKYFSVRCPSIDGIINEINTGFAALTERRLRGDRAEAFAMDYEAIAVLISRALEVNAREHGINNRLTAKLAAELAPLLGANGRISATGKRRIRITASGIAASGNGDIAEKLRQKAEKLCKRRFCAPTCTESGGALSISSCAVRRLEAKMAYLSRPKNTGEKCGDSVSVFENREDYFYSMVSDGMGSGNEAALTSGVCSVFLKKMLSAGNAKDTSIEMLNDLVRSSGEECSATVDLFELDLITGKAAFIKSGAAPSFLKRGARLFRIQSKTLPIGIMRAAEAEQVCFDAEAGDTVVMISDGVAQSYEDCPWLLNLLSRSFTDDLPLMCSRILDAAEENNVEADDRSVCIIKIFPSKEREKGL